MFIFRVYSQSTAAPSGSSRTAINQNPRMDITRLRVYNLGSVYQIPDCGSVYHKPGLSLQRAMNENLLQTFDKHSSFANQISKQEIGAMNERLVDVSGTPFGFYGPKAVLQDSGLSPPGPSARTNLSSCHQHYYCYQRPNKINRRSTRTHAAVKTTNTNE